MRATCRGGETEAHRELKRLAAAWAIAMGFGICAAEVRLPRSRYRADVAACRAAPHRGEPGETVIFECKQSRADLLRDTADERRTLERLAALEARRRELERMLGLHLPNLRRGESLFPEYDDYDFEAVRHDGWHAVRREEAALRAKLFGATKLAKLLRYRCAERHYLVVAPGIVRPHEVPEGWGMLELRDGRLVVVRRPGRVAVEPAARVGLLQAIALAAARRQLAALGVDEAAVEAQREGWVNPPSGAAPDAV